MDYKDFIEIGYMALDEKRVERCVRKEDSCGSEPDEGKARGVTFEVLVAAYERCVHLYGERPFVHVVRHVLAHNLFLRDDTVLIQSHRVKDAQDNMGRLLRESRAGHPSMFGGYQKDMEPVVMISVDQLIDLVGDAMNRRSMADLLPAGRSAIDEPLEITHGTPANPESVDL